MKRETLKSLGVADDVIDSIMTEYGNSVNSLKSKQNDLESQINDYKKQLNDRDKQLEELKKSTGDAEALQNQIAELQAENKRSSDEYEAKLAKMAVDNAVTLALTKAKAKNPKAVRALLDLDNAKLDGETVLGLSDQIAKLQESESYLFDFTGKPAISGTKPAESTKSPAGSKPAPNSYEFFLAQEEAGN